MNQFMFSGLVVLMAYLIGSISFAVVVSKLMGLPDPHSYGSGNPGATNVLRTGSKAAAVLTLLGDAAKGYLAVILARALVGVDIDSWVLPAAAVAAAATKATAVLPVPTSPWSRRNIGEPVARSVRISSIARR